jgi:hypothetical protein
MLHGAVANQITVNNKNKNDDDDDDDILTWSAYNSKMDIKNFASFTKIFTATGTSKMEILIQY